MLLKHAEGGHGVRPYAGIGGGRRASPPRLRFGAGTWPVGADPRVRPGPVAYVAVRSIAKRMLYSIGVHRHPRDGIARASRPARNVAPYSLASFRSRLEVRR